jgi:hypothetical protein
LARVSRLERGVGLLRGARAAAVAASADVVVADGLGSAQERADRLGSARRRADRVRVGGTRPSRVRDDDVGGAA